MTTFISFHDALKIILCKIDMRTISGAHGQFKSCVIPMKKQIITKRFCFENVNSKQVFSKRIEHYLSQTYVIGKLLPNPENVDVGLLNGFWKGQRLPK